MTSNIFSHLHHLIKNCFFLFLLFLGIFSPLMGQQEFDEVYEEEVETCCNEDYVVNLCRSQRIFVEPDVYYVNRNREGGSKQHGWMHGVKVGYNRIKRNSFYWEINGQFGEGRLRGKTSEDDPLVSRFDDLDVEGRIGFTIQRKAGNRASFTPYGGYGYFKQTNRFLSPSPIEVKFRDNFHYFSAGFLSQVFILPKLAIGFNFEAKFMIDGKCRVSDDPDPLIENLVLACGNKTHYEVELPVSYFLCGEQGRFLIGCTPFYQLRKFGGHENYPFDFLRTRLSIYGARLVLAWQF